MWIWSGRVWRFVLNWKCHQGDFFPLQLWKQHYLHNTCSTGREWWRKRWTFYIFVCTLGWVIRGLTSCVSKLGVCYICSAHCSRDKPCREPVCQLVSLLLNDNMSCRVICKMSFIDAKFPPHWKGDYIILPSQGHFESTSSVIQINPVWFRLRPFKCFLLTPFKIAIILPK